MVETGAHLARRGSEAEPPLRYLLPGVLRFGRFRLRAVVSRTLPATSAGGWGHVQPGQPHRGAPFNGDVIVERTGPAWAWPAKDTSWRAIKCGSHICTRNDCYTFRPAPRTCNDGSRCVVHPA